MAQNDKTQNLETFVSEAREWFDANVPRAEDAQRPGNADEAVARARELQRLLYDNGWAGLVFPKEYGGQGLDPTYARAFTEVAVDYEAPLLFQEPTLNIIAPTILDCGTEAQRQEHLSPMLSGAKRWVQFLSEPGSGSDVASTRTSATPVAGGYILNGSKIWSSGADRADMALCPARTNWDVPKHKGLTVFLLPIHQVGIEVRPIRLVDGSAEFCQEFLTDVFVPNEQVLGAVGEGWSVIMTLINHERRAVAGASPYTGGMRNRRESPGHIRLASLADKLGRSEDHHTRELIARQMMDDLVKRALVSRCSEGLRNGALPESATLIMRLYEAEAASRRATRALQMTGPGAVSWLPESDSDAIGANFLMRQASAIGGGTAEMARNGISERMLEMPREVYPDRGVPFSEVARGKR